MPQHHRGAATKQTGVRRPQPEGRQGVAATRSLAHTACQDFCHGLLEGTMDNGGLPATVPVEATFGKSPTGPASFPATVAKP